MKQAVLVIDVQESFRRRPYWDEKELPAFYAALRQVLDQAADMGIPAVRIFHHEPDAPADDPFSPQSGLVRTLEEIHYAPVATFHKTVHSALYAKDQKGTTLEQWLREQGIEEVIVCGIRTEQCCETTTRHASDAGFQVRFVADATLTFPMVSATGRRYTAADIRDRTTLVLDGRFARIVDATGALAG